MLKILKLNQSDNIGVVIEETGLIAGELIPEFHLTVTEPIPRGHKVSLNLIAAGKPILKFNHLIGIAKSDIKPGSHVHVHNISMPAELDSSSLSSAKKLNLQVPDDLPNSFLGYRRKSGRAGTRNYLAVIATVNCSATVVKAICQHFKGKDLSNKDLDGVIPVTHSMGCAQAIGGLNYTTLNNTLAGWTQHPNVVGNLYIGLGCEGTTYDSVQAQIKFLNIEKSNPEFHFNIQDVGGTQAAIDFGIKKIEEMISSLPSFPREELPVSELGLALNCGGSDAFSALTANPALGVASDYLTSLNGASVLAEIPECHGAEGILTSRAANPKVVEKLKSTFAWWERYSSLHKVSLNNNLSPGNIEGGISTIIEKSLGAVSKGGWAPLMDVVDYAHPIPKSGFSLMNTPGFDPVSVTGLVAGGCNIVCFTTGRGSVYGCSIAPTIKISTNTKLFDRMTDDIDFNAGTILSAGASVENVGQELYKYIIKVASGYKTKSELLHLGWEEFTPWPIGETL